MSLESHDPLKNEEIIKQAGILSILNAQFTNTLVSREIHFEKLLESLRETGIKYDTNNAIGIYYGIEEEALFRLVATSNHFSNPQRQFDDICITSFVARSKQDYILQSKGKYNVIDFGGAYGHYFYQSKIFKDPQLLNYYVCDLPAVRDFGLNLKASLLTRLELAPEMKDQILSKITFISSLESLELDQAVPLFVICNGVYMHLPNPADVIKSLFLLNPSSLFLGNNFEAGPNLENRMKEMNHPREYVIVDGSFGAGKHAQGHLFAINRPGNIFSELQNAISKALPAKDYSIISHIRDFNSLKLFIDCASMFLDCETNVNYIAWSRL